MQQRLMLGFHTFLNLFFTTLSFLDHPSDLVRIRVLSKKWSDLTASFPIFHFNINFFAMDISRTCFSTDSGYVRDMFFKYVEHTTSRFCQQNNATSVHTFNLFTDLNVPTEVDIIDRCLKLVLNQGMQNLMIRIKDTYRSSEPLPRFRLPNILLSGSSLKYLMLCSCDLPLCLMVDAVKFKSLKILGLDRVPIDDELITRLTTGCPLLKEFHIRKCDGFKRFCVSWHQNLQKVQIFFNQEVERIDIEAPNLCYLSLLNNTHRAAPCMNLASCKKLTTLYHGSFSPSFADFSSNFPFSENLFLSLPNQRNILKLSSHSLRRFALHALCDLEEIFIHTPNLILFEYYGNPLMLHPFKRDLSKLKSCMEYYPKGDVDTLWFQKLRQFLEMENRFKVLKLQISTNFIDVEALKVIQSKPYELEHVDLEMYTTKELSVYEALLWMLCFGVVVLVL